MSFFQGKIPENISRIQHNNIGFLWGAKPPHKKIPPEINININKNIITSINININIHININIYIHININIKIWRYFLWGGFAPHEKT